MKGVGAAFRRWFGGFRVAYLPVLLTYLCFVASMVTSIALLYFEKDTLGLTPAEAAGIAFWLGLPWSMKMVVGVASDVRPSALGQPAVHAVPERGLRRDPARLLEPRPSDGHRRRDRPRAAARAAAALASGARGAHHRHCV